MRLRRYTPIFVLAAIALYFGWRHFWFLTDDAFIDYRYISNAHLGFGYVWNPPPFRPVEGYSSFLWVAVLDVFWRITGVEPPDSANPLSLICAGGTLAVGCAMLLAMPLGERLARWRWLWLSLALVGILTNRTFLAWTSSGLETALFNFVFTAWIAAVSFFDWEKPRRLALISTAAALTALTRPDGVLTVAATGVLGLIALLRAEKKRDVLLALLPLVAVPAHLLWRHARYGEWLPNTYFAKHVAPWPESGAMYFESFVYEYALWIWFWLVGLALMAAGVRAAIRAWPFGLRLGPLVAISVVLYHFYYYTYIIGGDHFEYRVYSHLIVLIFVSFVWAIDRLRLPSPAAALALIAFIGFSEPIPWIHWKLTHWIPRGNNTWRLRRKVAPELPESVQWYGKRFDDIQEWLIKHYVCMRHQEHRNFYWSRIDNYPTREVGAQLAGDGYPVTIGNSVGVLAWVLPNVSVIDQFGLNDYIIARNKVSSNRERTMAHDRGPPPGYPECFQANVDIGKTRVTARPRNFGANDIVRCETTFLSWINR